mmetsp:Transcript_4595/g.14559  ORF Transcript_4595/g.14559 Transcript_4595/m.14559 type:complete len:220 (-) Transcript_4595:160-819(-)
MSKPAMDWTLLPSMVSAILVTTLGTTTPRSRPLETSSSASWQKSQKGESRTIAFTDISPSSRSASCTWYKRPVTAPMDRPQTAMRATEPEPRRWSTTTRRSSFSHQPNETYLPSLLPDPAQSKENSVSPKRRQTASWLSPSSRADELPCMNTTHGSSSAGRSSGSQCEHCSARPRWFTSTRSVRTNVRSMYTKRVGPSCSMSYSARGGRIIALTNSSYP